MKLSIATIVFATLYMQVSTASSPATNGAAQNATVPNCGYPTLPLLRAWSQSLTDHFYTANATEMEAFLAKGYVDQGIAAYILPSDTPAPTAVPLFRLYCAQFNDHFYTASVAERDFYLNYGLYVSDGITGYVYADQECGTVPLYQLLKPPSQNDPVENDHFYTTNQEEMDDFIEQLGYEFLEITAYVNPQ